MNEKSPMYEKELLRKLHEGDTKAFEYVFKQFQPALVFFANRLLGLQAIMEAEEIVQDTFLKLYDRRKSFVSLQQVKAFVYITTKNACLQKIEKEQVKQRHFEKFTEINNYTEDIILQNIIYVEILREVSSAIELLPEQCRIIMKKFFEEGKNAREISEEMQITVSTVNNQKARAISLLKKRLSGAGMIFLMFYI